MFGQVLPAINGLASHELQQPANTLRTDWVIAGYKEKHQRYNAFCWMIREVLVSYRVQQPVRPIEQLCMDIKYVYIHDEKRNALLLTVLDVYSRSILSQVLWWRIRKEQVIWLLHKMLQQHSTKGITLRW